MAGWSVGEAFYFVLTPFLLGWAVHGLASAWFNERPGHVALIIAIPYLGAGYQRNRPIFALVGAAALGTAAWLHFSGVEWVWAMLALVLLWAALDHALKRDDGRWYALGTLWAALDQLFAAALISPRSMRCTGSAPLSFWAWSFCFWRISTTGKRGASRTALSYDASDLSAFTCGRLL